MKMIFKQRRNFFPPSKLKCEAVACLVEHNADVLKGIEERHIQRRVVFKLFDQTRKQKLCTDAVTGNHCTGKMGHFSVLYL